MIHQGGDRFNLLGERFRGHQSVTRGPTEETHAQTLAHAHTNADDSFFFTDRMANKLRHVDGDLTSSAGNTGNG